MIKAAIEKILELGEVEGLSFSGRDYTDKEIFRVEDPVPRILEVHTLTGLVDYVEAAVDPEVESLIFHVREYRDVGLLSGLTGKFLQRPEYINAHATNHATSFFSYWHDPEAFIIGLQSLFVQEDDVKTILKLVGNLKDESVRTVTDDGTTQSVAAMVGIARVADVEVPNPVTLSPYRTFLEIEQPASQFVFRLRTGREGQLPTCALFEADGARWQLQAIGRIRDWLKGKLPDIPVIA